MKENETNNAIDTIVLAPMATVTSAYAESTIQL